ncbi:hypothetical protein BDZ90DRAFT_125395 [Jaminaea rosea]|uniref:Uncharacterized protein n=1 Tax=Jaminaea rosea TaxID=1569628 RepID=A0A316UGM0_9BASI|nr:hypothetical protein BDZ90DRAFT_125395 [Jaminaea rosea]PWN24477.1 hypothetical protein BDZ90DRAFT_125395 [Jaminaea rosea]
MAVLFSLWLLLLLSHFPRLSYADHYNCTWDDAEGESPQNAGYVRFCWAPVYWHDYSHAVYNCDHPVYGHFVKVADWGYLRENTLEFSTPCGGKGFAPDHDCNKYEDWALCNAAADATINPDRFTCRMMHKKDDCQWFESIGPEEVPPAVDIWIKKDLGGKTRRREIQQVGASGRRASRVEVEACSHAMKC